MFNVTHTYDLKDEQFKVQLYPLDDQEIEYHIQLNPKKYDFLREEERALMMKINSKQVESEVIVLPGEILTAIDNSIETLVELELYEQCAVLKKVKDEYIKYYQNDYK
jgi:hypothetical protein